MGEGTISDIRLENSDLIIVEQEQVSGPKEIKDGDEFDMVFHVSIIPLEETHATK